ncbi:MAG: hypothetical protein LBD20_05165, partial [Spirochaetaceae bacterium]|nr:hypothetical protein [Spirochaetaceae bacterium]
MTQKELEHSGGVGAYGAAGRPKCTAGSRALYGVYVGLALVSLFALSCKASVGGGGGPAPPAGGGR